MDTDISPISPATDPAIQPVTGPVDVDLLGSSPGAPTLPDADIGTPAASEAPPGRSIDDIERLLGEVEDALARLDDGTYGRCSACGATIDDERLAAAPTATTCAACDAGIVGPV